MWQQCYSTERTVEDNFLCIKGSYDGTTFVLPPFGIEIDNLGKILDKLIDYFQQNNLPFIMKQIPASFIELVEKVKPNTFQYQGDRDAYDYVYNAVDLAKLEGRKYHRKRNHLNNFKKEFPDYQYCELTSDLIPDCKRLAIEWCEKRNCDDDPSLECEKCAVLTGLNNFAYLELKGGVILLNGKVEAFTFGEPLNDNTAVIHVEKANPDIKGLYAAINQEFCQHQWQEMEYINREEDLGLAGLRKAKESYYPVKMVEKFIATLK